MGRNRAAVAAMVVLLAGSGCAFFPTHAYFERFFDGAIPAQVSPFLRQGRQSGDERRLRDEAVVIEGVNRREIVYRVVAHLKKKLRYEKDHSHLMLERTAADIIEEGISGGCSDYTLAAVALLRVLGVPARMVITVNWGWRDELADNPFSIPRGHTFAEVFLEDRWFLLDVVTQTLSSGYEVLSPSYPRRELFCRRGVDLWSMGMRDVGGLQEILSKCLDHGGSSPPRYRYERKWRIAATNAPASEGGLLALHEVPAGWSGRR